MSGQGGTYLIGLDLGTQSIRALLASTRGVTLACVRRPTPTTRIDRTSAEYDPDAFWEVVVDLLAEVAGLVPAGGTVAGISCASMGESVVLVDDEGRALAPALAWFDRRTDADAETVANAIGTARLFEITGYPPDPTLSLCKILWHRREQPEAFARTKAILPISPWIAFRLSGVAAVDPSLAARTLCLDAHRRDWSGELLDALGLDVGLLPPIRPSGTPLGPVLPEVLAATGLPGRPIVAVGAQDHISGGFVAGATRPGLLFDSLGTSEAILATAESPPLTVDARDKGFVQTSVGLHRPYYLIGSGVNRSGGSVEWARNTIARDVPRADLIAEAAAVPPGSGGVCFLPHLTYCTAPTPDTATRGAFVGLTDATSRGAMFRAVLEGIALEARVVADALFALPGVEPAEDVRVIGGGTQNPLFLEIKASVMGRPLTVVDEPEATALGAALLGGVAAGLWPDFDAARADLDIPTHVVTPRPDWVARYEALFQSVYRDLYLALRDVNHRLTALERTDAETSVG